MPNTTLKWRHQYDPERDRIEQEASNTESGLVSLTQQQFKDDADLNIIIERMGLLGTMPGPLPEHYFQDVSELPDLRAILDYSRDAEAAFMALPAKVRARFHNSSAELWEFVHDENNREEAIRLGLIEKPLESDPAALETLAKHTELTPKPTA